MLIHVGRTGPDSPIVERRAYFPACKSAQGEEGKGKVPDLRPDALLAPADGLPKGMSQASPWHTR